jgi:hypothetical protein
VGETDKEHKKKGKKEKKKEKKRKAEAAEEPADAQAVAEVAAELSVGNEGKKEKKAKKRVSDWSINCTCGWPGTGFFFQTDGTVVAMCFCDAVGVLPVQKQNDETELTAADSAENGEVPNAACGA